MTQSAKNKAAKAAKTETNETPELTKAQTRRRFGIAGAPIPATRIKVKGSDHDFNGTHLESVLVINDNEGTYTSANIYINGDDQWLGKGFDAECMTHPLPAPDSDKWKAFTKRGYADGNVSAFALVLEQVEVSEPDVLTDEVDTPEAAIALTD